MNRLETRRIVLSGMFIALVVVATFINVPYPGSVGGLMHLGTLMLIIISLKFIPLEMPVPRAFEKASFAANLFA